MRICKKIKSALYGWRKQPTKAEVRRLVRQYEERTKAFPLHDAIELMGKYLIDLVSISRYAESGEMKALSFSYRLGILMGRKKKLEEMHSFLDGEPGCSIYQRWMDESDENHIDWEDYIESIDRIFSVLNKKYAFDLEMEIDACVAEIEESAFTEGFKYACKFLSDEEENLKGGAAA